MKKLFVLLSSRWLTGGLLVVLIAIILIEIKITTDWHAQLAVGEKAWEGADRARALASAIEQYCVDFSDEGPLGNTRQWTERLGGHNPKGIRYLKTEKYPQDSSGRLLDACGSPWVIDVPGSPRFEHIVTPEPADEFHVRSTACPGFAFGHRKNPTYPRS
jgi:hypothetical protein